YTPQHACHICPPDIPPTCLPYMFAQYGPYAQSFDIDKARSDYIIKNQNIALNMPLASQYRSS
ncbi:MAG: hypothetical protein LBE31_02620, partial [Deltaproteobacteria bacterium]|nr:hypothetical protein [Deltaproteobacteria bacterium]